MVNQQETQINSTNYLWLFIPIVFIAMACAAFSFSDQDNFDAAKQEIIFRKIGHQILLNAGDRTSRVLPVKKIAADEYQLRFENEFTFDPDSLVHIIKTELQKYHLGNNYIVNVLNCADKNVVFGYAILSNERNNIISCSGRRQPKGCYLINLKFQKSGMTNEQKGYLIGGLPLLAFVGLLFTRSFKTRKPATDPSLLAQQFKIGDTLFNAKTKKLYFVDNQVVELTSKENKLLLIFASSPNVIIERSRLQKEIWEDEGVIVGRSLDMFISKLRKKLEADRNIDLVNIHGKGYKLQLKNESLNTYF